MLCERPCPLGFTRAVIVVCERVTDGRGGGDNDDAPSGVFAAGYRAGGLPWEGVGRRAEWHVLRKVGRVAMVPFGLARGALPPAVTAAA